MPGLFDDVPVAGETKPAAPSLFGDLPDAKDTSPKVSDYLKVGGESLLRAVPATVASGISAIQGQSGVEAPGQEDIFEKGIRRVEQGQREFEQRITDQFPESEGIQTVSRLGGQLGYSLSSMVPGIAAGVAAAPTAAVTAGAGPFVAGGAAAGVSAYRSSSAQILRSYIDTLDEEKRAASGQGLTPEETEAAKADFSAKATEYGLWEALPEAAGGAVAGRLIFGPLRKIVGEPFARTMLGRIGAGAGVIGEELATETATAVGQSRTLAGTKLGDEKPLDWSVPGVLEAAKQVAPDVLLLTALLGGGTAIGGKVYRDRKEARLARELDINRDELRARVTSLLEQKVKYPDIPLDIKDPTIRQYLAGAVQLREGKFVPKEEPVEGTIEPEAGPETPQDLAPTTPLAETPSAPLTAPAAAPAVEPVASVADVVADPEVQSVAAKVVAQPEVSLTKEEAEVVSAAPQAVATEVQKLQALPEEAVVPSVEPAPQAEPPLVETQAGTAPPTPLPAGTASAPRGVVPTEETPKLPPMPQETLPGLPALKRGYKRTVFTLDAPGFQGDTFIEDVSTKGKKTLMVLRRTGQLVPASTSVQTVVERKRVEGVERPAELPKFSREQDIAKLHQGIANYLRTPVAPESYTLSSAPASEQALYDSLEQLLGKRIVFFEATGKAPMRFNGVSRINPGVLYVNAKAAKPLQSIVGHEFLHELKMTDPDLYAGFKTVVLDAIPAAEKQKMQAFLSKARAAEGQAEYDAAAVEEELIADFFGEQFTTKEFWAKIERRNPQGFARLVEKFLEFVEKLKAVLQGEQAVALTKAQDAAADALARYIRKDTARVSELSPKFAAAWHGSPKRGIKAFDKAFIGTGEGAQAFGYGHYFTTKKEIAEWYKERLAEANETDSWRRKDGEPIESSHDVSGEVAYEMTYEFADDDLSSSQALPFAEKAMWLMRNGKTREEAILTAKGDAKLGKAIDLVYGGYSVEYEMPAGGLYRVELAPAEDEYLRWDLPLSEQSEKVKAALSKLGDVRRDEKIREAEMTADAFGYPPDTNELKARPPESFVNAAATGEQFYRELSGDHTTGGRDQQYASEYLHSLGIRGIKYPAESLTASKKGTGEDFNYVVFDDADIQITAAFNRQGGPNGQNEAAYSRRSAPSANARKSFEAPESGDYGRSLGARGNAFRDSGFSPAEVQAALIEEVRALEEQTGKAIMPMLNQTVFRNHASFEAFLDDYAAWAGENQGNLSFFEDMRGLAEVYREVEKRTSAKGRDLTSAEVQAVEKQAAKTFNQMRDEMEAKNKQERELAKLVDEDGEPTFSRETEDYLRRQFDGATDEQAVRLIGRLDQLGSGQLFGGETPRVSDNPALASRLSVLAGVFGHHVVLLHGPGSGKVNGFVHPLDSKRIYLFDGRDKNSSPDITLLGHELVHQVKRNRPELYAELVREFASVADTEMLAAYIMTQENRVITQSETMSDATTEEWVSDIVGRNFASPSFWEAFYEEKPSLAVRIAKTVNEFVSKILRLDTRTKLAERTIADLKKAEEATAKVLAKYVKENPAFARYEANAQQNIDRLTQVAKAAKQGVTSATSTAPRWLKVMPLSGVVDIYKDRLPLLKTIKELIDTQTATRNQDLDTGELNRRGVAKAFGRRGIELFNNAAGLNSLYQMRPTPSAEGNGTVREWYEQDWVPENLRGKASSAALKAAQAAWDGAGMGKATGVTEFMTAYRQGREAYEKLSTEQKSNYQKVVDHYHAIRLREKDAMLKQIDSLFKDSPELHAEMKQRLDQSFKNLKGNYTSLYRRGDYSLSYKDRDGLQVFMQLPSEFAANMEVERALAEGADPASIQRSVREKVPRGMSVIPGPLMDQLRSATEAKFIDSALKGVDETDLEAVAAARSRGIAAAAETVQEMNELFFRWLPETAAMKNSMRRKSTLGFSEDHLLAYMNYVQSHANNISYLEYGRTIEETIDAMGQNIRLRRKEGVNVEIDGHILNDLRERLQAMKNSKTGPVTAKLGKLTSVWFMSSPSTALVQMSQLGVFTLPYLSTRYGLTAASAKLTQALGWAFSPAYGQDNMMADTAMDYASLHEVVTSSNQNEPWAQGKPLGTPRYTKIELNKLLKKRTPEQLRQLALREALARNVMNISLSYEATEASRGEDPESLTNKVAYGLMTPMRASELASRKAAILSAFELERDNQKEFDFFGAMDKATEAARETMFDYSKENKGVLLQGSTASLLARFQTFRIMSTFRLGRLAYQSLKETDPATRTIARREFIGIMGMSAVLAGMMGTPFAVLFDILDLALGDDDEPVDSALEFDNWLKQNYGETAAAVVGRGAFAGMNLDVHRRIGMDFFQMGALDAPAGTRGGDYADFVVAQLLGPSYSMGKGFLDGWQDMNEGRTIRGLEQMVPKGIRDVLKSYRLATEGLENRAGKKLISDDKIGADDLTMMAFGFSPDEINQATGRERKLTQMSVRITQRRSELVRSLVQAFEAQDGEAEQEARQAIAEFNRKMRPFAVRGDDIRDSYKKRRRGEKGLDTRRERQVREKFGI